MEGWLNHPVVDGGAAAIAHAAGVADNASVAVAKIIIRSLPKLMQIGSAVCNENK